MASAYSTPQQFDNYVAPVNVELVNFVLGSKEQKFNYNIEKVEQTLSEFGNLGLVRDQDKEYLADRLNTIVNEMGDIQNMDWSDSNIERQITSGIRGAIDEKVINDIQMSKRYTGFMEQMKTMQDKQSDKFSETNMAYALHQSGVANWLNGESESFRNINYTPYQNVTEEYRKILDDSINLKRGITRQVEDPDNPGRYITTEHYGLTQSEIRDRVTSTLTPDQQKQLEINSWGTYGDRAAEIYNNYSAPKITQLNKEIAALQVNTEGKTEAQKARDREEINSKQRELANINARKESPSQLHQFIGTQSLIEGLSNIYAPVETKRTYQTNDAYFKQLEQAEKNINGVLNIDGNRDGIPDVRTSTIPMNPDETYSFSGEMERKLEEGRTALNQGVNQVLNRLDENQRNTFNAGYEEYLRQTGLDDSTNNKMEYLIEQSNGGKGNLLTPRELIGSKTLLRQYNRDRELQSRAYDETLEELRAVSEERIFNGLKSSNNRNLTMLDENGRVVPMVDYIRGAQSLEQLPEQKRTRLLESVYADITLSQTKDWVDGEGIEAFHSKTNYNIGRLAGLYGETASDLPMLVNPNDIIYRAFSEERLSNDFNNLKTDMQLPQNMTREQFEESIRPILQIREEVQENVGSGPEGIFFTPHPLLSGVRDIISEGYERFTTNLGRVIGTRSADDNIIIGGEGTQTRQMLEQALENGIYDDWSWDNDSVEDEGSILSALNDRGEFQTLYESKMRDSADNFGQNQEIVVQASGTREGENVPAWHDLVSASENLSDKGGDVWVRDAGDYYAVRQVDRKTVVKDGKAEEKIESYEGKILKTDIAGGSFESWIRQNETNDRITTSNTQSIESEPITFADNKNHRKYLSEVSQLFGIQREADLAPFSEQGAKASLVSAYPRVFQDPQAGQRFTQLMERMVENSDMFRVTLEANTTGNYVSNIQYKGKENGQDKWMNLNSNETLTNDITDRMAVLDVAPSMVLYEYMHRLFSNINDPRGGMMRVKDELRTLENLFIK